MSEIKYPVGGYAPGNYSGNCSTCGELFTGAKRARQCEPCAINMLNESYDVLLKRNKTLETILSKVKDIWSFCNNEIG